MSGHSKWASIKHKKAATDAKKGKIFTKLIREVMMAARNGGGNPDSNPRLRLAIEKAKEENMPAENIKRAVQKGTGEGSANQMEEISYEGYGPAGVAIKLDAVTDNKRRTASEIRSVFSKNNGNLGEVGCVSWMFERKGQISIPRAGVDEDALFTLAIESGAEDVASEPDFFQIYTRPEDLEKVRKAVEEGGVKVKSALLTMQPKTTVRIEGKDAEQLLRLLDALEDHDDVQTVYSNFEISDDLLEKLQKE
ncbi:MAG: YebC/PmpR family DNA-binding transcriptional regulator [Candidatus Omnitrophica bacterium]|nr:YebC/PmpR family DNA-binding transcriptional regulator [Candidatus Omnitrophota bacterium]